MNKPRVLFLTGGDVHDFDACAPVIEAALADRFELTQTRDLADVKQLATGKFDALLVHTQGRKGQMTDEIADVMTTFVENGGGFLGIHCASDSFVDNAKYMTLIGSQFAGHGPMTEFTVRFTDPKHPVAASCDAFRVYDEFYVLKDHSAYETFAVGNWQGKDRPLAYQKSVGKGKLIYLANGHDPTSLGNRDFQRMLERSLRVVCGETFDATVRAGILGYGGAFNMGKKHAESINGQPGMTTTAVCDLDPSRTDQAKQELGDQIKTFNDMNAFFSSGDFDMMVCILPHNLHAQACIEASEAGLHVVTEKPFCVTLDEADQMIAAANSTGKMLSCFHNRRWDGDFLAMLHLVRENAIGQVFRIDAASANYGEPRPWWRSSKEISGGVMYDWGAHYCDWLLNLMNKPIQSVTGDFQKRKWHHVTNEDYTYALIRFMDGTTATLEQGSMAAIGRGGFRILGTEGGITNAGAGRDLTLVTYPHNKRVESVVPKRDSNWESYYANVRNHLIMGEELVVTAEQARRAIGVIALAEQSAKQDGMPLELPGERDYTGNYMLPW